MGDAVGATGPGVQRVPAVSLQDLREFGWRDIQVSELANQMVVWCVCPPITPSPSYNQNNAPTTRPLVLSEWREEEEEEEEEDGGGGHQAANR